MTENDSKSLITPISTPTSVDVADCIFVPFHQSPSILTKPKKRWYIRYKIPYAITSISIVQILCYCFLENSIIQSLRFDPAKQKDIWRFFTYMFIHDRRSSFHLHLILNVIIQCIFAIMLEMKQGHIRVVAVYFFGGVVGALGSACVQPELLIGSSAGVYSLLMSHISHILLNFQTTKHKFWCFFYVAFITTADVLHNVFFSTRNDELIISWGAHASGALTGLLVGLVLYKNYEEQKLKNDALFFAGFTVFTLFLFVLIIVDACINGYLC